MRRVRDILRHELIGLQCKVVYSKNKSQIGIAGRVINETRNTITLITTKKTKKIPKKDTIFQVQLNKKKVDIKGNFLIAKPEDRIKKKIKKW